MDATKLLYLEDFLLISAHAIVQKRSHENDGDVLILDQTIFYPQGGGQPFDTGTIEGAAGTFRVQETQMRDGIVEHRGALVTGEIREGETVLCTVDDIRRALLSRIHAAGHVVDMAVAALSLPWVPGKGYHYPAGPYVAYTGSLAGMEKERLKKDIEHRANAFVREDRETHILFAEKSALRSVCHFVPLALPEGEHIRVVQYGDFGVTCGGTHVRRLGEIREITIRKIKTSGEEIRVGYDVPRV